MPLETITKLWLSLNCKPQHLWFNFDMCVLYFSDHEQDINSNAFVGAYDKNVELFQFQEDIKEVIKEESYDNSRYRVIK